MLQEAKARADACCDVNLMTSRCLDGTSKELNEGIVVVVVVVFYSPPPSLYRRGAPSARLDALFWAPDSGACVGSS